MISDETIANMVKNALASDPRVGSMDITVHSYHGRVQLQGDISSASQKLAAEEIARAIPGVTSVHNHLRVAEVTATTQDF
ncbi:MAG TPA: BON domain-containing protein [Armatimonadota bacterium]|nr:BON domain-containing protein [Armatimonadota bacterium]